MLSASSELVTGLIQLSGSYTGEEIFITTLVLPSVCFVYELICCFCFHVGEITQGRI